VLMNMIWKEALLHFNSFQDSFTIYNGVDASSCIIFAVETKRADAFWECYIEDNILVFRKVMLSLGTAECVGTRLIDT